MYYSVFIIYSFFSQESLGLLLEERVVFVNARNKSHARSKVISEVEAQCEKLKYSIKSIVESRATQISCSDGELKDDVEVFRRIKPMDCD